MNRREAIQALMSLPATAVVTRAEVGPSDAIVIETEQHLTQQSFANIQKQVELVWPGRKCIVMDGGMRLRIAKDAL